KTDASTRLGSRGSLDAMDNPHTQGVIKAVEEVAEAHGASLSQVTLNWVARRAGVASIIIGARTTEQLADNLGAVGWSLTDDEMAKLDAASARPPIYPYDMHKCFMGERNPSLGLLPPVAG
ncbi:MAG: aldo/keto reductase, partial [Nevskiales bacterium]